jgi:membrane-associated phospholipid phosphatase
MNIKHYLYDWCGYNKIIFNKISGFLDNELALKISKMLYYMGDNEFQIHLAIIAVLLAIYSLRQYKKSDPKLKQKLLKVIFVYAFSMVASIYIVESCKDYFGYPRPFCNKDIQISNIIKTLYPPSLSDCFKSFPSGHSAYIAVTVLSFWSIMSRRFRVLGLIVVLAVGGSRIALCRHFPADVIGGYTIAIISLIAANKIFHKYVLKILKI